MARILPTPVQAGSVHSLSVCSPTVPDNTFLSTQTLRTEQTLKSRGRENGAPKRLGGIHNKLSARVRMRLVVRIENLAASTPK